MGQESAPCPLEASFFQHNLYVHLLSEILLHFPTSKSSERNMPSKYQCILNFTRNSTAKFALKYFKPVDPRPVMRHKHKSCQLLKKFWHSQSRNCNFFKNWHIVWIRLAWTLIQSLNDSLLHISAGITSHCQQSCNMVIPAKGKW